MNKQDHRKSGVLQSGLSRPSLERKEEYGVKGRRWSLTLTPWMRPFIRNVCLGNVWRKTWDTNTDKMKGYSITTHWFMIIWSLYIYCVGQSTHMYLCYVQINNKCQKKIIIKTTADGSTSEHFSLTTVRCHYSYRVVIVYQFSLGIRIRFTQVHVSDWSNDSHWPVNH